MKTVLMITRYHLDGKPEVFARAYLPTEEEEHEDSCACDDCGAVRAKGIADGRSDVDDVYASLCIDETRDGHGKSGEEIAQAILDAVRLWAPEAWGELAANMDSYGMSNPGKPRHCRPAYYAAYKIAANQRAAEILAAVETAAKGEVAQ